MNAALLTRSSEAMMCAPFLFEADALHSSNTSSNTFSSTSSSSSNAVLSGLFISTSALDEHAMMTIGRLLCMCEELVQWAECQVLP